MSNNLENLTIHAFRGLRELELEQLGRINLFVGPNNSGKTSVLEAIATFSRPLDPQEWVKAVRRRELKASGQRMIEGLRWMFPQTDKLPPDAPFDGETRITGNGQFPVLEAVAQDKDGIFIGSSFSWNVETEEEESSNDLGSETPGVTLTLSARTRSATENGAGGQWDRSYDLLAGRFTRVKGSQSDPQLPVVTVSQFAHRIEQIQSSQLTEFRLENRKGELVSLLRLFDEDIDDLEILSRDGVQAAIYVQHRRLGLVPLNTFGDGLRRALVIATSVISAEKGNLLIDEIESSIHVSALAPVFKWLIQACLKYEIQLFATTHSLEAVDAILSACDDNDYGEVVGYHLDRTPEKAIARRFEGELLHRLRFKRGLDVR